VDPMHNLFLGSAKHFLKAVWLEKGVISAGDCSDSGSCGWVCCAFTYRSHTPQYIFWLASFTADQFKNWIVYFSVIALRDMILSAGDILS